jgi:hypothetical protein
VQRGPACRIRYVYIGAKGQKPPYFRVFAQVCGIQEFVVELPLLVRRNPWFLAWQVLPRKPGLCALLSLAGLKAVCHGYSVNNHV